MVTAALSLSSGFGFIPQLPSVTSQRPLRLHARESHLIQHPAEAKPSYLCLVSSALKQIAIS